jgi:hypothetical protein
MSARTESGVNSIRGYGKPAFSGTAIGKIGMAAVHNGFVKSGGWRPAGWPKWALRFLVGLAIGLVSMLVFYAGVFAAVLYSVRLIEF